MMNSGNQTERCVRPTFPAKAIKRKLSKYSLVRFALTFDTFKTSVRLKHERYEEGFTTVFVMWFVILLGLLGANLLREARATHYTVSTSLARLQAQAAADGAINFVIQNLLSPPGSTPLSFNGELTTVHLLSRDIAIKVEDEAGKIDITTANFPLLSALIRGTGASSSEADFIAENVIAWRLPQDASMGDNSDKPYLEAGRLYGPRRGPFRAIPELRLVFGMTDPIQAAVAPFITIWSDHAGIDRETASDTVLDVLAAAADSLAAAEIRRRSSGANVGTTRRTVLNRTFSIVARVTSANVNVERHAVVRFVSGKRKPYVILDWS